MKVAVIALIACVLLAGKSAADFNDPYEAVDAIKFYLYTRDNPKNPFLMNSVVHNSTSPFKRDKPVKVVIHGWNDDSFGVVSQPTKDTLLEALDVNVILLDWAVDALGTYPVVATRLQHVGKVLGFFLNFLMYVAEVNVNDIHVIGHSFGGQIAGFAGQYTNGTLARITGLDPAAPLIQDPLESLDFRLDANDAQFVDVIHTGGGPDGLGFSLAIGDVDFYVNGGNYTQPGCAIESGIPCSHHRSVDLFQESLTTNNPFIAVKCNNYDDFINRKCTDNDKAEMGNSTPNTVNGTYFLNTNSEFPFSRGPEGIM